MQKNLIEGFLRGLLFGLVYALAETFFVFKVAGYVMEMLWDPFTMTTVRLMGMCVVLGTVNGTVVGLLGGRRVLDRPSWHVHLTAGLTIIVAVLVSPEFDQIMALAMGGIGITHGFMLVLTWLLRTRRQWVIPALALFSLVWFGALKLGLDPKLIARADTTRPKPAEGSPNVLWIVLDTTRYDHLSLNGYERKTTPYLEELAKESTVFERAYAAEPWTMGSHGSMFTGLYSAQHWCNHEHLYLNADRTTGAEILRDAGYDTAIFAGNPWFGDHSGLVQGFQTLDPAWREFSLYNLFTVGRIRQLMMKDHIDKGAQEIHDGLERWLASGRDPDRPFFAFVNLFEPHAPYDQVPLVDAKRFLPPDVTWAEAQDVSRKYMSKGMFATDFIATDRDKLIAKALYDGGIYHCDRRIREFIDMLKQSNQLDNTLVIINADHGEMFGEHEVYGHDVGLYHPLVHVPLLMRYPKVVPQGMRIDKPVQLLDLHTTMLEVTGLSDKILPNVKGKSLLPLFSGGGDPERPVFAEYYRPSMRPLIREVEKLGYDPKTFRLKSVQIRDQRLIRYPGKELVFDIGTDPEEDHDLTAQNPELYQKLKAVLDQFALENPPAGDAPGNTMSAIPQMDAATKAQLDAVGYVQSVESGTPTPTPKPTQPARP